LNDRKSASLFEASGALSTALENRGDGFEEKLFSHSAVLITAAGLQGEQPLVNGTT